ncbi:hypothetical protein SAMN05518670_1246 [Paenibacillus sp. OK076]|nr:hypothetical protein SAMN05518670_1246 [Paenibacillus sp. OK076]
MPGLPLDSDGPAQAQAGPLRAGLRPLPGSLLRFAKDGSCCTFGAVGRASPSARTPCSASRRTGAVAPLVRWAGLRPLPGLPAPLREGRELLHLWCGGQGFASCPDSLLRFAKDGSCCTFGAVGRASPSARLPAPLREGRERYFRRRSNSSAVSWR